MIITIASGKGGTGKTTFSVNLAYALTQRGESVRLLDCDVEEPNDHLFIKESFCEEEKVFVKKPVWHQEKCTGCGACEKACNYNAIALVKNKVLVFNDLCHSCGVCSYVCHVNAFEEKDTPIGKVEISKGDKLFFAHGVLNVGESLAPTIVKAVKKHIVPEEINIIDAAPGTACPVVEAVTDSDITVLITEPTPFGLNDLKLAAALASKLGVKGGIVINRSDGEDEIIEKFSKESGIPILGRIPFNRVYAETYSRGDILIEKFPELQSLLLNIYEHIITKSVTINYSLDVSVPAEIKNDNINKDEKKLSSENSYTDITVISGKGGTGKTTVTASLAELIPGKVIADTDVDAADLHLILRPQIKEKHEFSGHNKYTIDHTQCMGCGRCAQSCHFDAINLDGPGNDLIAQTFKINEIACEGCGLCSYVCPVNAISAEPHITGEWFVSTTSRGEMVDARLGVAEENSGKLVTKVKNRAAELVSQSEEYDKLLADGPPGTGCPVIASVSGADMIIIVTEPTVSGIHDMKRVLDLAKYFGVKTHIIINKADINCNIKDKIYELAKEEGSKIIGEIPFDEEVSKALSKGISVITHGKGKAYEALKVLSNNLLK